MRVIPFLIAYALIAGPGTYAEGRPPAWPCYWTHGRITAGNGTPSLRIWPSGTHRLLGVVNKDHPFADDAYDPTLPDDVANLLIDRNHHTAWGDFYVCPVAPERAGWMRFVIVKKARRLFVEPA